MASINHDSSSSFQLRGTHLSLLLDDIVATGTDEVVHYIDSLIQQEQLVESVFVKGAMSRNVRRIPEDIALKLFRALSRLDKINSLEISGDGRFGGLFLPVQAITASLQPGCRNCLQKLRLGYVILTTTRRGRATTNQEEEETLSPKHMQDLAVVLRKLPCLSSIDIVRSRSESDDDESESLEPIILAIASMLTIQQAMLCETLISNRTGMFLGKLAASPSIQKLWWKTMPEMDDSHIVSMVQQLKTNVVLMELTIRSHGLGVEAGQAIADLLLVNTTLQVINLDLDRSECGLPIAAALRTNTSLKCLDVWAWGGEISPDHSRAITKVFTNMLQSNWVLNFLTFQGLDWTNPDIDFYLRLNRAGRQRLWQNFDDKAAWTKALIKHKDDLDVIYHFLSRNPNILISSEKENTTARVMLSKRKSTDGTLDYSMRPNKRLVN